MPDTSPVGDTWTWQQLGTGIAITVAAIISWFGSHNGKKDKESAVASGAQTVANEFMDITVQRQIMRDTTRTADAVEALVHLYAEWKKEQDEAEEEAEKRNLRDRLSRAEAELEAFSKLPWSGDILKRMDLAEAEQKRQRKPPT